MNLRYAIYERMVRTVAADHTNAFGRATFLQVADLRSGTMLAGRAIVRKAFEDENEDWVTKIGMDFRGRQIQYFLNEPN